MNLLLFHIIFLVSTVACLVNKVPTSALLSLESYWAGFLSLLVVFKVNNAGLLL